MPRRGLFLYQDFSLSNTIPDFSCLHKYPEIAIRNEKFKKFLRLFIFREKGKSRKGDLIFYNYQSYTYNDKRGNNIDQICINP